VLGQPSTYLASWVITDVPVCYIHLTLVTPDVIRHQMQKKDLAGGRLTDFRTLISVRVLHVDDWM
jgi:hypothetical protein